MYTTDRGFWDILMPMSTCINGYIQIKFDYYNPIHTPYPYVFFGNSMNSKGQVEEMFIF